MDLVFLVSGMAAAFALKPDRVMAFVRARNLRLMVPLVFGILVVVPIQPYAQGVSNGSVAPGFVAFLGDYFSGRAWPQDAFDGWEHGFTWNHLWYLAYLWVYTLALALLAGPLASGAGRRVAAGGAGPSGRVPAKPEGVDPAVHVGRCAHRPGQRPPAVAAGPELSVVGPPVLLMGASPCL
jgi:hypothetical protein